MLSAASTACWPRPGQEIMPPRRRCTYATDPARRPLQSNFCPNVWLQDAQVWWPSPAGCFAARPRLPLATPLPQASSMQTKMTLQRRCISLEFLGLHSLPHRRMAVAPACDGDALCTATNCPHCYCAASPAELPAQLAMGKAMTVTSPAELPAHLAMGNYAAVHYPMLCDACPNVQSYAEARSIPSFDGSTTWRSCT